MTLEKSIVRSSRGAAEMGLEMDGEVVWGNEVGGEGEVGSKEGRN
jgi:hypothetical protein